MCREVSLVCRSVHTYELINVWKKRSLFLILLRRDPLKIETKKEKKNEVMTNHPQDLGFQLQRT